MSIFKDSLKVSFEDLEQDLTKRGKSRYLEQFRDSSVLNQIVDAISFETQDLYDKILEVLKGRTLGTGENGYAKGAQLDKIGYLIGQPRVISSAKPTDFFAPFLAGFGDEKYAVDVAKVYVKNGRLFEEKQLDDDLYYKLILAKIFKNHTHGASLPAVRLVGSYIYGNLLTLVKTGLQEYLMGFLATSSEQGDPAVDQDSLSAIYILRVAWRNTEVDDFYALPIPSTVYLHTDNILIFPKEPKHGNIDEKPNAFIPDTPNGIVGFVEREGREYATPNYPKLAIKINIGGIL